MIIKQFYRTFTRRPVNYLALILSIVTSFTSFIIIFGYLNGELSYDIFWGKHGENVYRLIGIDNSSDKGAFAQNPPTLINDLKTIPEIKSCARVFKYWRDPVFNTNEKAFFEKKVLFVDTRFLDLFHFEFKEGDKSEALRSPFSVIITRQIANKYWANGDAIGKTLTINQGPKVVVTGIIEEPNKLSHLDFDIVLNIELMKQIAWPSILKSRGLYAFYYYFSTDGSVSKIQLVNKFNKLVDSGKITYSEHIDLQNVADIHLNSNVDGEISQNGSKAKVRILIMLSILILTLGIFNLSNFAFHELQSIAEGNRVKYVLGAGTRVFIKDFFIKMILLFTIGFLLSSFLSFVFYNKISQILLIPSQIFYATDFWINSFVICLLTTLLAIIIPYVTISKSFKNLMIKNEVKKTFWKPVFLVLQLAISFILVTATLIIEKQIGFINTDDLGFQKKNMLVVPLRDSTMNSKYKVWKNEILANPSILAVSRVLNIPGRKFSGVYYSANNFQDSALMRIMRVNSDFNETLEIPLILGRTFQSPIENENGNVIISKSVLNAFGFQSPQAALGSYIEDRSQKLKIIGIIEDIKFESLFERNDPLILLPNQSSGESALIKVNDIPGSISSLTQIWSKYGSELPLIYSILEDNLASNYKPVNTLNKISTMGSICALLISALGIFTLSSVLFFNKFREMAIRKVLGARAEDVIYEFSKSILRAILIAFIISVPFAVYFGKEWLHSFVYRTKIDAFIFVKSFALILAIVLATMIFYTLKTVFIKPTNALRE